MANSYKQRDRQRAYNAGQLHEWHNAQREAEAPAAPPHTPKALCANAPDFAVRTEDGASWPADETGYSKYMKWTLPTQVASPRGRY
jgi:hypothetical protein